MSSERHKIDADYVAQVKKFPKSRAINPQKLDIMYKLKLKLVSKVKLVLTVNGFKCESSMCQCAFAFLKIQNMSYFPVR